MAIRIEPATAERWNDVVAVLGGRSSRPTSCWCQRFRRHDRSSNRAALRRELDTAEVPIGLLAYLNNQPVGWSRVVPRHTLAGITDNRAIQRIVEDDTSAWWVTCFAVRAESRGIGVGVALLQASSDYARRHGASMLDGHPVDTDRLKAKASPSALFTGTLPTFQAAGFHEIGRTYPSRPVMRINLR